MSTIQSTEESAGQVMKSTLVDLMFLGQTNHRGTWFGTQAWALLAKATL